VYDGPVVGQTLGSYRVIDTIGVGGMGVVYLAEHKLLGRKVAIKVLRPELSVNDEIVGRFFNEARASALIGHPGIIEVLDFGHHANGSAYLVMEHLAGENLRERLERAGRLPEKQALTLARQVAAALAAAHGAGIVHRDLKPDNLFLVRDPEVAGGERVKVLDFGIAKLSASAAVTVYRTRTGAVMGSPVYMSPEQCRGSGRVDERTDLYSLGCVLFEMVCGRPPFVADGAGELISMHLGWAPPSPRELAPEISEGLAALIERLLRKHVDERPASMAEVTRTLEELAGSRDPATRPDAAAATPPSAGATPGPPVTTTLGGGAAELTVPPGRRRRIVPVALVIVAAGAGTALITARRGAARDDALDAAPSQVAAAPPADAAPPPATPPPPADARRAPDAAPAPADAAPARAVEPPRPARARPPRATPPERRRGDPVDPFGGDE
jgi:serine/threonine-protein kinase